MKLFLRFLILNVSVFGQLAFADCKHSSYANFKASKIKEISGIGQSPLNPEIFFVHNDHGNGARFFALGKNGYMAAKYKIKGIKKTDFEDMSSGTCINESGKCLFFGDIGDNELTRKSIRIVQVKVPTPELTDKKVKWIDIQEKKIFEFTLPLSYNSEGMVYSESEKVFYVFTKSHKKTRKKFKELKGMSHIFKLDPVANTVARVGSLVLSGLTKKQYKASNVFITAADIDKSGKYLLLSTLKNIYVFDIKKTTFDKLGKGLVGVFPLPNFKGDQFEAVTFKDAPYSFFSISENGKNKRVDLYETNCTEKSSVQHLESNKKKKSFWSKILGIFSKN